MRINWISYILILVFIVTACSTPQENIIGIYDIDIDKGCTFCEEYAPKLMVFENLSLDVGSPGYYRCEFSNGSMHSGSYDYDTYTHDESPRL